MHHALTYVRVFAASKNNKWGCLVLPLSHFLPISKRKWPSGDHFFPSFLYFLKALSGWEGTRSRNATALESSRSSCLSLSLSLSLSLAAILFAFRRVNHFRDIVSPSLTPFAGKIYIQFTFVGLFHVQSSAKWY